MTLLLIRENSFKRIGIYKGAKLGGARDACAVQFGASGSGYLVKFYKSISI